MTRIKKAKTAAEKERLLTEMQNRIKSVADELERESQAQLKTLEKALKSRQRKRLQKTLEEKEAEMERLGGLREGKDNDKDVAKMRLYAEGEDLVPDILKETADHLVDKATATELKFDLDESDKD